MLAEPGRTAYDINFQVLNIPVRVSIYFFLMAAALGYNRAINAAVIMPPIASLAIWTGVVFFSILLHELGHSLVMRRFGITSRIVLYHFGGLAIPDGGAFGRRLGPRDHIAISAAGPGIQLLFAALVVAFLSASNYRIPGSEFGIMKYLIPSGLSGDRAMPPGMWGMTYDLLSVNIYWALLNLVPIYPLDGGQISREMFLLFNVPDAGAQVAHVVCRHVGCSSCLVHARARAAIPCDDDGIVRFSKLYGAPNAFESRVNRDDFTTISRRGAILARRYFRGGGNSRNAKNNPVFCVLKRVAHALRNGRRQRLATMTPSVRCAMCCADLGAQTRLPARVANAGPEFACRQLTAVDNFPSTASSDDGQRANVG